MDFPDARKPTHIGHTNGRARARTFFIQFTTHAHVSGMYICTLRSESFSRAHTEHIPSIFPEVVDACATPTCRPHWTTQNHPLRGWLIHTVCVCWRTAICTDLPKIIITRTRGIVWMKFNKVIGFIRNTQYACVYHTRYSHNAPVVVVAPSTMAPLSQCARVWVAVFFAFTWATNKCTGHSLMPIRSSDAATVEVRITH